MAAHILLAKYYPTTSILEASVGRCSSFAGRSIMSTKGASAASGKW
jgi:hypothetical protein